MGLDMRVWPSNDAAVASRLRPSVGRFEVSIDQPAASVVRCFDLYARLGMVPQPLIAFNGVPSASQLVRASRWIRTLARKGLRLVEFGNEDSLPDGRYRDGPSDPSYALRAERYARAVKRLADLNRGTGVGLLVQVDDGGSGDPTWVDHMYKVVPDLQHYAAGWTIHPYGPQYAARIDDAVAQMTAHGGGGLKLYATEWGLATDGGRPLSDNGGWPTNLTYAQAASIVRTAINRIARSQQVAQLIDYQSSDQASTGARRGREEYFGAMQADGSRPKGALTTVIAELLRKYR